MHFIYIMKIDLNKSELNKKTVEDEYYKSIDELKNKTEELERLKIELKDIKLINKLKKDVEQNMVESSKKNNIIESVVVTESPTNR